MKTKIILITAFIGAALVASVSAAGGAKGPAAKDQAPAAQTQQACAKCQDCPQAKDCPGPQQKQDCPQKQDGCPGAKKAANPGCSQNGGSCPRA